MAGPRLALKQPVPLTTAHLRGTVGFSQPYPKAGLLCNVCEYVLDEQNTVGKKVPCHFFANVSLTLRGFVCLF